MNRSTTRAKVSIVLAMATMLVITLGLLASFVVVVSTPRNWTKLPAKK